MFSVAEISCRCDECKGKELPTHLLLNVQKLKERLIVIRKALRKPVIVNSWIRCPAHNKAVSGAENSRHLRGEAADIRVEGMSPTRLAGFVEGLIACEEIEDLAIGTYPTFIHVDLGPAKRWEGK